MRRPPFAAKWAAHFTLHAVCAHQCTAHAQGGMAWSGSDSDDDAMALVGIAFEGAVSPGGSDEEDVPPPGRWV